MNIDTHKLLLEYFDDALESIKKAISIPSVRGKAEPKMPYGKPTKDMLDFAINLAKSMGFKTFQDPENCYGYVDYGSGKEIFGILGHLDVVPAGDLSKWDFAPFEPGIKDGKLLGRGSLDDKGPMIINLYALKYLKDHDFVPDYTIRLIFGLTEETDWDSIHTYLKKEITPAIGYTPDGEFPVVYAEKGISNIDLKNGGVPFILKGGEAYNCVNDIVTYQGPFIDEITNFLNKQKIEVVKEKEHITVKGKAAHGSTPEKGINAATHVLNAYAQFSKDCPFANFVQKYLHNDFALSKIINFSDETGLLVVNNGIIDFNHEHSRFTLNMRVPVTYGKKDVLEPLTKIAKEYNIKIEEQNWEPPLYIEQTNPLIVKIMKVYREVTGDKTAKPIAIGGGTYAKAFKNCVAFGAEFDIEESTMHAYNEYIKIAELKKMLEIYTKAIALLTIKEKD